MTKPFLYRWFLQLLPSRKPRASPVEKFVTNLQTSPPDQRDFPFRVSVPTSPLPDASEDLSKYAYSVQYQGRVGCCGSEAISMAMEVLMNKKHRTFIQLSPRFHYFIVRQSDYMDTFPDDSGQFIRTGLKAAKDVGIAPEKLCVFDENAINDTPSDLSFAFAKFDKVGTYQACYSNSAIQQGLANGSPVVIGIRVYDSIYNTPKTGELPDGGTPIGGHALCLLQYDNNHQNTNGTFGAYKFINSWGTNWGNNGYGWLPYDYVMRDMMEAWAISALEK